jgi:hypothetical protein
MPTHKELPEFLNAYRRLSQADKDAFQRARREFVRAWKEKRAFPREFPAHLGIKRNQSKKLWEFRFGPDKRALFDLGKEQEPGEAHIIWREIGGHDIYLLEQKELRYDQRATSSSLHGCQ